ncbi:MAG: helix-turn-helix domain-containing protein [Thermoanaerobaculia bacterium]
MPKRKKTEVEEWLDGVLADPVLASAVEERMAEMKIEQELVALREREGLSQRDLAMKLGTTQPYIAKLESGRVRNVGLKTLARYAAATGSTLTVTFAPARRRRKATGNRSTTQRPRPRTTRARRGLA